MNRSAVGVVVLGMARSGTSAVTGMFVSAGFYVGSGDELMGAHESNPAGHFENLRTWRVNEDILAALGGAWFEPPAEQEQVEARSWAAGRLSTVMDELLAQADGAPVAVKDPRIGVMMPLWQPVIGALLHPVLVTRDPVEIALSLSHRDGTPVPFALAAWELHMSALLAGLKGRVVTVAPYHELLDSPELAGATVASVAARLAEDRAARVLATAAATGVQPGLRRNHVRPRDHDQQLTGRQRRLWRFLASLPSGEQTLDVPTALLSASAAARRSVRRERDRLQLREQLELQGRELAERAAAQEETERRWMSEREEFARHNDKFMREYAELIDHLRSVQGHSDFLTEACSREQARAEAAERLVDAVRETRSWRMTAPLRAGAGKLRAWPLAAGLIRHSRRSGA
jgi:hypothetical protein